MQSNTTKIKAALARLSSSSMGASVWAYSKLALGGGLVALLVVFSVQNANDMQVRFLGWETRMSQSGGRAFRADVRPRLRRGVQ